MWWRGQEGILIKVRCCGKTRCSKEDVKSCPLFDSPPLYLILSLKTLSWYSVTFMFVKFSFTHTFNSISFAYNARSLF